VFVVDTNVLVHAVHQESTVHAHCRDLVNEWRLHSSAWYTTWGVICEFLRVVTHPKVLRRPWRAQQAWSYVEGLLASPGLDLLVPTERHAAVFARVISEVPYISGNLVHDAATAVLMREHGVSRIVTRDTAFRAFPFLDVIDPLSPRARL
jgi:toxin-antitoxin system PIN domain toxin